MIALPPTYSSFTKALQAKVPLSLIRTNIGWYQASTTKRKKGHHRTANKWQVMWPLERVAFSKRTRSLLLENFNIYSKPSTWKIVENKDYTISVHSLIMSNFTLSDTQQGQNLSPNLGNSFIHKSKYQRVPINNSLIIYQSRLQGIILIEIGQED